MIFVSDGCVTYVEADLPMLDSMYGVNGVLWDEQYGVILGCCHIDVWSHIFDHCLIYFTLQNVNESEGNCSAK